MVDAPSARPQQNAVTPPAPEAPRVDEAKNAALHEHRELLMLLDTRAASIRSSLKRMEQEQARSGLGLRGDMVTSQQRMDAYLNEAEVTMKAGDPVKVKKNLDSAEREIEKLEKFLGR